MPRSIFSLTSIGRLLFGGRDARSYYLNGDTAGTYELDRALKCVTVYGCVQIIAQGIGEVTFQAPEDAALDAVLRRPNEWQSATDFWEAVTVDA